MRSAEYSFNSHVFYGVNGMLQLHKPGSHNASFAIAFTTLRVGWVKCCALRPMSNLQYAPEFEHEAVLQVVRKGGG